MSDASQGPGWWMASDGKWYPRQSAPRTPAPPPVPPKSRTGLLVGLSVCGGLFLLVIIMGAVVAVIGIDKDTMSGATSDGGSGPTCKDSRPEEKIDTKGNDLYVGRPDAQDEDHEATVGDCVRLQGYTAYVTFAAIENSLGALGGDPITVLTVTVENRDNTAKPYNVFDWSIQTASGQVLNPTIYLGSGDLESGDLLPGASATGKVAFDAPPGRYYVVYKPGAFDAARGIWQITS